MADKDFLVDVSFNVDQTGAQAADKAVVSLEDVVKQLGAILLETAQTMKSFFDDLRAGKDSASGAASTLGVAAKAADSFSDSENRAVEAAREMTQAQRESAATVAESVDSYNQSREASDEMADALHGAGEAASDAEPPINRFGTAAQSTGAKARKAASDLKEANKHAAMSNAKTGTINLRQMEGQVKRLSGTLKRFIGMAATAFIGSSIGQALRDVDSLNRELANTARILNMSMESARAHTVALSVMGKTYQDIWNDRDLKATYDDLTAIGKKMALPEAAQGLNMIQRLKDGLMQLKVVGNYALQWIYYKIQTIAEGPLTDFHNMLTGMRTWVSGNIEKIATGIATAFGWVIQIFNSVITVIKNIISWIDKLPPSIKLAGAAILTVFAAIKSRFFLISLIVSAVLLLIDDFVTYMEGGQSLFGDFWGWAVDAFEKVSAAIKSAKDDIVRFFEESKDENGKVNWIAFGLKIGKWILDGAKAVLSGAAALIKKWITGDENATWTEVGEAIIRGIRKKASDILSSVKESITGKKDATWPEVAEAIINGLKKHLSNAGAKVREWIAGKPGATWSEAGQAILNGLRSRLSGIGAKVREWITGSKDSTWSEAGQAIIRGLHSKLAQIGPTIRRWITGKDDATWSEAGHAIVRGLRAKLSNIGSTVRRWITGRDNATWGEAGSAIIRGLKNALRTAPEKVKELITGDKDATWPEVGQAILTGIEDKLSSIGSKIKGWIIGNENADWSDVGTAILNGIYSVLGSLGATIKGWITGDNTVTWSDVGKVILDGISEKLSSLGTTILSWITGDENASWGDVGQKIFDGIQEKLSGIGIAIRKWITGSENGTWTDTGEAIWNGLKDKLSNIGTTVREWITGKSGATWGEAGEAVYNGLTEWLSNVGGTVRKWITGEENATWSEAGKAIWRGLIKRLSHVGALVKRLITGDPNASWSEMGQKIIDGITSKAAGILSALKTALGLDEDASFPDIGSAIVSSILTKAADIFATLKSSLLSTKEDWADTGSSLWDFISDALLSSAQKKVDFWSNLIDDGIDRGGALGTLESTVGRVFLLVALARKAVIDAVNKLQENGTLGTMWETLQTIALSVFGVVTDIINSLTGRTADGRDPNKFFETLSSDVQGAIEIISGALQAAESALGWVLEIINKAAEMGILDDVLKGIAATLIAIKSYNAIQPLITMFSAIATGVKVLGLANPQLAILAGIIAGLAIVIPKVVDGWNRWMYGISEEEAIPQGLEVLENRLKAIDDWIDDDDIGTFVANKGQTISEFMREAVGHNAYFSDSMKEMFNALSDNDWIQMYKSYKENGAEAIHAYVDGLNQAADEASVELPGVDDSVNESIAETKRQSEEAAGSVDELMGSLEALNGTDASTPEMSFDDAVSAANDLIEQSRQASKAVLDTSSNSQESIETVKVASEEAAQGIIDAFVNMGKPIGPVFDSIVIMCKNMVSRIRESLQAVPRNTKDTFTKAADNAKKAWSGVADWFSTQINKIRASINSLPTNISFSTSGLPGHSEGAVITKETVARVGEGDKKEYIIPVTKPGRAASLLRQAAADLGMTVSSTRNAAKVLGGDATRNVTPAYAAGGNVTNNIVNNYNNVDAPATINVHGTDAKSTADNVSRNQTNLVLRNIKAAIL